MGGQSFLGLSFPDFFFRGGWGGGLSFLGLRFVFSRSEFSRHPWEEDTCLPIFSSMSYKHKSYLKRLNYSGQNLYLFSDQNDSKTIPFGAKHTSEGYFGEFKLYRGCGRGGGRGNLRLLLSVLKIFYAGLWKDQHHFINS